MVLLTAGKLLRAIGARTSTVKLERPAKLMMKGRNPIIRTRQYLEEGIVFRDCVKILTIHFGDYNDNELKELVDLNFSQLQYKNPNVQILCLKNLTPTPFLTFFLDDGEKVVVDVEGMTQLQILQHIQKAFGKPRELVLFENKAMEPNPANFGKNFARKCICTELGQLPCMSTNKVVPFDKRDKISGKRNWNYNPKKYPNGIEEIV
uniref:Small ribosomal subunit protein mS25 n=1 Tax=Phallusia mammillata TaxID=59560 RepID=A0A6F9DM09_9ASCI|nr:28S ribosomal protein S25, mitochondrial-like [Phallusia mammillata]